jgi:crotonobetainyl-CoA:carnitine CoA-transferase CaiB-like acyl-CoA transferase
LSTQPQASTAQPHAGMQPQAPGGARILDGYRVVDCSEGIAGPVAAMLLAEAGADVVKVERPGGDPSRSSLGFLTWNRSKRSVVLDLETADGRGQLEVLLRGADVLVHGFGPARAAELGLTDDELRRRHPHLVTSSVLSWPAGHPSADGPIDDLLVSARLGLCDEQLGHREGPVFLRFPFGSWCAVYLAAVGILARLVHRGRGGPAGPANTSVAQGALVPTMMHWARADHPGEMFAFGLPKDLQPSLFECADGVWIHLMRNADVDSPLMAQALADMGPDGVAKANATFTAISTPGYPNHGANQVAFRTRPSQEWLDDFWSHDIPAQPAAPYGAILADPQVRANDYVVEVDDPARGRITQAATPFSTEPPSRVSAPAPDLGQHTDEVLSEPWAPVATPPSGSLPSTTPLGGLRVLDLGNFLAGPLGPMLLADLGAEVIKVEATTGDQMRRVERVFAACQRGKKGVALDLKSPGARQALEELVRWADVVHHNLRMPAARRLGLDYESLRAINPDVVYCHTSSYGPRGDRADWPGYDQLFQAAAGWEVLGGGEGNNPMWFRFGFMDHLCAMGSVVATLLAVLERDRTGRGQRVTGSLLGGAVLTNSETFLGAGGLAASVPAANHEQTGLSPGYRLYRLSDGWIALCARDEAELERACSVAGADDPLGLEEALSGRSSDDALSALGAAGVPCEPVRLDQGEAFLDDPLNRTLRLVVSYDNADWGELEQVGAFWDLGNLELALDRAPPALGEHTVEVLREVGLEPATIDRMLAEGAALQYDSSRPAGDLPGAGSADRFELARRQHAQRGSSEQPASGSTEATR